MLSHAAQVEANELLLLKAALALQDAALDTAGDVARLAGDVKDTATGLASSAVRAGKTFADTANPLNAMGAMR